MIITVNGAQFSDEPWGCPMNNCEEFGNCDMIILDETQDAIPQPILDPNSEGWEFFPAEPLLLHYYCSSCIDEPGIPVDDDGVFKTSIPTRQALEELLVVSPNPAQRELMVQYNVLSSVDKLDVSVQDITGREVMRRTFGAREEGLNQFVVDVADLSQGTYTITVWADDHRMGTQKVVIQR